MAGISSKRTILGLICWGLMAVFSQGQEIALQRVEPPSWWTGFKNTKLQILVYGKNIGSTDVTLKYPGVALKKVQKADSPDYLFIDLDVTAAAKPGIFSLLFRKEGKTVAAYKYTLLARKAGSSRRKGFNSSDVIYLLVPDRFANGDPANDQAPGMTEAANRTDPGGRHGGDLKGIEEHLDYIKDLGATAIWMTPLLENNMEVYSYHGYSTTDYYRVDPRFGTNADYFRIADSIHGKGMKLIMDMVFNHCGSGHWWMKDLPWQDWLNQWPEFTRTNYKTGTTTDPYVSGYDSVKFVKGWFDKTMPDLNQHNPFLAKYLIQNSIWWIEMADLDGIRQDTYPYCFRDFMSEWDQAVLREYPDFNIVGECWSTYPAGVAYWQKDALNRDHFNSYLPSVFDFPMYDAIRLAFMEPDEGSKGITLLYETLGQDLCYPNPSHIVIFADNHDTNRSLDSQGDDIRKLKMAMVFVLTTRGIPEIYYGTEVLLTTGKDKGDGQKRKDFPGGWPSDAINAFTAAGRTDMQNGMYSYLNRLMTWRKDKEVIHTGRLKQFAPQNGIYVYFRFNEKDTVMVVMNNSESEARTLDRKLYNEFLSRVISGKEVITGITIADFDQLSIPAKSAMVIELKIKN
jgi:neopullulanase